MTTRTIKMMGNAYSTDGDVTLTVSFNGTQVHSGTVTTTASDLPDDVSSNIQEMFTFSLDSSTTGDLPISITASGGSFVFASLQGNYALNGVQGNDPATIWDYMHVNTVEQEGKKNPQINGSAYTPARSELVTNDLLGPWCYVIKDGETFTCDYEVRADQIVTDGNNYPDPSM
jgi:hypothetical protein